MVVDLAVWQKLNVTAFLATGIAASAPEAMGEPYLDGAGRSHARLLGEPILIFAATPEVMQRAWRQSLERGLTRAAYVRAMFATGHDAANRQAFAAEPAETPDLVGPLTRSFNQMVDIQKSPIKFNQMVESEPPQLSATFHALGDATRRRMLRDLAAGERSVGELAKPFSISLAAASKHIKVLEHAGLIRREVRGRTHLCRLDPGPLATANEWLSFYEGFWTKRLDVLDRLLRQEDQRPSLDQGDAS